MIMKPYCSKIDYLSVIYQKNDGNNALKNFGAKDLENK